MKIALFLDFDGTITTTKVNSWKHFRDKFGIKPSPYFDMYGAEESIEGRTRIMQEWTSFDYNQMSKLITDDEIRQFLDDKSLFRRGLDEFSKEIQKNDNIIYTALISGGYPDIVKTYAKEKGWDAFTHEVEVDEKGNYHTIVGMQGIVKKKIMQDALERLSKEYGEAIIGVYVADNPQSDDGTKRLKGYELEDYGKGIVRIHMGKNNNTNGEATVHDFYDVVLELQKLV